MASRLFSRPSPTGRLSRWERPAPEVSAPSEVYKPDIATLDLSDNHIQDPEIIPEVFAKMTELRVLYLKGNPVVRNIPNYRKTVIASLPDLKYLDDRPVFEEDRRYAEAFVAGGLEGEREMRRIIKKEKEDYHTKQMQAFQRMMAEGKERKRELLRFF